MAFYVILGLYTIWVFSEVKQDDTEYRGYRLFWNSHVLLLAVLLIIIAAFRLVALGVGGTDAIGYKNFFEQCNNPLYASDEWFLHQDIFFRYITKFLRLFTGDYHFYFIVLYGFNVIAYILFLLEFCQKKSNSF